MFGMLIVKHAIWVHRHENVDFVLARNPFAIVKSLKELFISEDELRRRRRLVRWARKIDLTLVDVCRSGDEAEAIARLYLAKMTASSDKRLGVIRYEDLVADPKRQLKRLVHMLGLPWSESVLNSHERYEPGLLGHGNIKLSEPIRRASFSKQIDLEKREFEMIASITKPALDLYGYRAEN